MPVIYKVRDKISSFQIIILGFGFVILLGTLLLMLPSATKLGVATGFEKALFTAVSAVCVTGLVIFDTATYWSFFGQTIILILIQIGGLGVITVAIFLFMLLGRKISLKERETMQNALSAPQMNGIVRLTRFIFISTFTVEGIGSFLLLPVFVPRYGKEGIWMSVFHSVSAFCNAGFDIMGDKTGKFSSLTGWADNLYLTMVISLLIVIGGIGFITWNDVSSKKTTFREYTMQTKVIFSTTIILIILPAIYFFLTEFSKEPLVERICLSIFQSVTPRTAGFNMADMESMTDTAKALSMILMLIGGSPGSTAGGMKTTTLAILIANAIAVFRKRQNAHYFGRRVDDSVVKNASAILFMYTFLAVICAMIICSIEKLPMQSCLFETFSAIGTVGLSLGITAELSTVSHIFLIGLMFFGRVGGLTIIYAALSKNRTAASKYPVEGIMIG